MNNPSRVTRHVLALVWAGNMAFGVAAASLVCASIPFEPWLEARLVAKYGSGIDVDGVISALRIVGVLGIVSAIFARAVLAPLRRIMRQIEDGEAFAGDNADRLTAIGRALLGIQLLDLANGGLVAWFTHLGVEAGSWTPSLSGWLGVLLAFVLAQVFREGAAMRDDLAMTV